MKRYLLALITIVAMSVSGPANATFLSGHELLSDCTSGVIFKEIRCEAYVMGIEDTIERLEAWEQLSKRKYCLPDTVPIKQLTGIFIEHANKYPENLKYSASSMVMNAFYAAFPCE
jgi:hypothetical protein